MGISDFFTQVDTFMDNHGDYPKEIRINPIDWYELQHPLLYISNTDRGFGFVAYGAQVIVDKTVLKGTLSLIL